MRSQGQVSVVAAVLASSGAHAQRMVRASVSWDGQQANGDSGFPVASAEGRFVAFESDAINLVPGDTNGMRDVFVRDLRFATTERISVSSSGSQALAGSSERPSISADGRYVLFGSWSSDLAPNDTFLGFDLLLRDRVLGTTELVDVSTSGIQANGNCRDAALTPDARFVAFAALLPDLLSQRRGELLSDGSVQHHERRARRLVASVASARTPLAARTSSA